MRNIGPFRLACVVVALGLNATAQEAPPSPEDPAVARNLQALLDAHNAERNDAELPPLALDETLTRTARRHAEDMAERGEMTHEGADGSAPVDRVKRNGYHGLRSGENVAKGQRDVAAVMRAWMNSPGHKKNILGAFSQMGAARVDDEEGEPYWCVVFGTPIPLLDPAEAARDFLERADAARKEAGKPPLPADAKLAEVAQALARDFAESTSKPEEDRTLPDLEGTLKKAGIAFGSLTQHLAAGTPTAEDLVQTMLADDEKKAVLLGEYRSVGIGYARGAEETPCWCLLLVED